MIECGYGAASAGGPWPFSRSTFRPLSARSRPSGPNRRGSGAGKKQQGKRAQTGEARNRRPLHSGHVGRRWHSRIRASRAKLRVVSEIKPEIVGKGKGEAAAVRRKPEGRIQMPVAGCRMPEVKSQKAEVACRSSKDGGPSSILAASRSRKAAPEDCGGRRPASSAAVQGLRVSAVRALPRLGKIPDKSLPRLSGNTGREDCVRLDQHPPIATAPRPTTRTV